MKRDILDVSKRRTLSDDERDILAMAIDRDLLRYGAAYTAFGERAWSLLDGLKKHGLMAHPAYNHWEITEKGRLAYAFATLRKVSPPEGACS